MANATCSIDDCEKPVKGWGWCRAHYERWKRHGDPLAPGRRVGRTPCRIEGCDEPLDGDGLCADHRRRLRVHGDPLAVVRVAGDTARRFWIHVDTNGPRSEHRPDLGCCWTWGSQLNAQGYGLISDAGRKRSAHRYAYELLVEPIPAGLDLDHLCLVRHCVKPTHLEPVTHAENMRRMHAVRAASSVG